MTDLKARVRNGRLVLDEPTDLPEGTEVDLVPADWWDDVSAEDRRRLEQALAKSEHDVKSGRFDSADDLLGRLRTEQHIVLARATWHAARGQGPDLS